MEHMPLLDLEKTFQLAMQHQRAGRLADAEVMYLQILHVDPNHAEVYFNLGHVLRQEGKIEGAITAYARAIIIKPEFLDASIYLGNLLATASENAVRLASRHQQNGRLNEAEVIFRHILAQQPDHVEALHRLGVLAGQYGKLNVAVDLIGRAVKIRPDNAEALNNLGLALARSEKFDEALRAHEHSLALVPNSAIAYQAIGVILMRRSDAKGAIDNFQRSVDLAPNVAETWRGLGSAWQALGEFDKASDCFRHALAIEPEKAGIYSNLLGTGRGVVTFEEIDHLIKLANKSGLSIEEKIGVNFALGKALDETDCFDEAFKHYATANSLAKQWNADRGEHFDGDAFQSRINELIQIFTSEFFGERRSWGQHSEVPVFVLGMPRSGTTLVEQIASSHPRVFGAGEMREFARVTDRFDLRKAMDLEQWNPESIQMAARSHWECLKAVGGTADRVIDKTPDNILLLGLIGVLFPSARVIFCNRDARDNCLSCFFQWFSVGNLFSYNLADCGRRYLETKKLMRHWRQVLPLKMLEVQYEELVSDLEGQSHRLIDFLGLPWDPACLSFHETKRSVLTASSWQVRQPIYNSSVGRWRHYEKHLAPLLKVLESGRKEGG